MTMNPLSVRKRRQNRRILIPILIAVLALVAGGTFWFLNSRNSVPAGEEASTTDTTTGTANDETEPAAASDEDKWNEVDQYEGENPNTLETLTGSLTHAASDGTNLVIRVNIDQALSSGSCRLNLTSGDYEYMADATIFSTGSVYSSCEGFDVPLTELSAGSVWQIKITLTSSDKTGTITGEVRL